jgi:anti-sigma factor (TIGR02949 family)
MSEHSDCERALSRLYEFLDHELADADADQIRAHLDACEPCLDAFGVEEAMRAVVRRCCSAARAPEGLRVRVTRITTIIREG